MSNEQQCTRPGHPTECEIDRLRAQLAQAEQRVRALEGALEQIALRTDGPSFHLGADVRAIINVALRQPPAPPEKESA